MKEQIKELVQRVQGIFLEVPGTRLSVTQAARLTGVDASVCHEILKELTASHFMKFGHDGTFTLQ
jgi:DNA-binding IclR family transcriptional regulator